MCDCDVKTEFHDSYVRVARKPHRCLECNALIVPKTKYHYKVGLVFEGYSKRLWQAKLCQQCDIDWEIITTAENRVSNESPCICYSELGQRIVAAYENNDLTEPAEIEVYLRWFGPDPEEIGFEPRFLPGGVHPDEAWRLVELPFSPPLPTINRAEVDKVSVPF